MAVAAGGRGSGRDRPHALSPTSDSLCVQPSGLRHGLLLLCHRPVRFRPSSDFGEIVEQVVVARRAAQPDHLSNVVFMGMGEPLANYDRVWEAIIGSTTTSGCPLGI